VRDSRFEGGIPNDEDVGRKCATRDISDQAGGGFEGEGRRQKGSVVGREKS